MTFTYYTQSKLVFGVGSEHQLEDLLRENHATSVLLVYSGEYVFDLGIHDVVDQAVRNLGATLIETGDVVPNPRIDLVRTTIDRAREAKTDFILAVGGGKLVRYGEGGRRRLEIRGRRVGSVHRRRRAGR